LSKPLSLPLKSVKKYVSPNGNISIRVKSVHETLARIGPICKSIGVTRISDVTYMDKLFIPNILTWHSGFNMGIQWKGSNKRAGTG